MSEVNNSNNAGNTNFEKEYDTYLRDIAMMDTSMDDLNSNGFDDSFGQPTNPVESPLANNVEYNNSLPSFDTSVLDQGHDITV